MMKMNFLAVVTSLSIYHGCSARKTFWELKFIGEEKFTLCEFSAANMKNCGHQNVSKHREIKGGNKYVTLGILLNFGSLNKMRIISSYPKDNLYGLVKWVDYLSGSQDQNKAKEIQKGKVCHRKCHYEGPFKDY